MERPWVDTLTSLGRCIRTCAKLKRKSESSVSMSTSRDIVQLFPQMEIQSHQTMADLRLLGLAASSCCLPQCPFLHNLLSLDLMMSNLLLEFQKEE